MTTRANENTRKLHIVETGRENITKLHAVCILHLVVSSTDKLSTILLFNLFVIKQNRGRPLLIYELYIVMQD